MGSDKSKRILIVDDEPGLREVMAIELEMEGYQVLTAAGGRPAFELLKQHDVDVIVSDVRMPDGDGIELLDRVQGWSRQQGKPIRMVLMTGFTDISREEALERGAAEMLSKPFLIEDLLAVINGQRAA